MKSLASILPDKAAMIVYWAEVFGFTNVRICCDPNIDAFRILVSCDPNKEDHISSALEALLTDKLGCNTAVLIDSRLIDLYVKFTLKQSVGLNELEKMKQLYKVDSLEEVSFEEIPSEEKDELLYDIYVRSRRLAERILKEKNIPYNSNNPSTLYQAPFRETNPPQSNNKEKSSGTKRQNDSSSEQAVEKPNKIISPPRG